MLRQRICDTIIIAGVMIMMRFCVYVTAYKVIIINVVEFI